MKIIVCNDTRNAEDPEDFPWEAISEFHAELLELSQTHFKGDGVDCKSLDPFKMATQILAHPEINPAILDEVGGTMDELLPTVRSAQESMNVDRMLCRLLRQKGHEVRLFDGHSINAYDKCWAPMKQPDAAANSIAELIIDFGAQGAVYDLDYFGNPGFGRGMLINLHNRNALPADAKVVIYSKYLHDEGNSPQDFSKRLPNLNIHFVDRNAIGMTIEKVAAMFSV